MRKKISKFTIFTLLILLVIQSLFFGVKYAKAAPTYDQTNGTYTDDFTGTTGIPTRYHATTNTTPQYVQLLRNTGSGFVAPFYTDGYVTTSAIMPTTISSWNSVSFNAVAPANTSVKIQFGDADRNLYSDDFLPGNSTGFTSSPVDISSIPPMTLVGAGGGKVVRLTVKIILTTTDTNVTPTFDDLVVSWTTKSGDLTATSAATTDWPTTWGNQQGTTHLDHANPEKYSALRWVSDKQTGSRFTRNSFVNNGSLITYSESDNQYVNYLKSRNLDTGEVNWQAPFNGFGNFSIGQNGTAYQAEDINDTVNAIDLQNGALKWLYNLSGGHGSENVIISKDGTVYTTRQQSLSCNSNACVSNIITVYAYNPDGSVEWTKDVTIAENYHYSSALSYDPSRDTLYFGTSMEDVDGIVQNGGKLYAFDLNTRDVKWSYSTGDISWMVAPAVASDGTIYLGNGLSKYMDIGTAGAFERKFYAINHDGTLKWSEKHGANGDAGYTGPISLRSDGVLVASYMTSNSYETWSTTASMQAINMSDGALVWEKPLDGAAMSHTDNDDFAYVSSAISSLETSNWSSSVGYYDKDFGSKWKLTIPYDNNENGNWTRYDFLSGQNEASSLVPDDRGWLYGALSKLVIDNPVDWNIQYDDEYIQYFALAPWTLSVSGLTGTVNPGDTVTLTATSAMQQTNLLLGGDNKVQAVMDNGDKVAMSYSSTNSIGDTIWTGTYTIPTNISAGEHTFTIEASQSYIQTDITTHFETASTESNNTGITTSGTFRILGASTVLLPEVGANLSMIECLYYQFLNLYSK